MPLTTTGGPWSVEGVSYNYNYTLSTYATGIPLLPSIGLRIEM